MPDTTTKQGQEARINQIADGYLKKSKVRGDYWWRRAAKVLQADGDFTPGKDQGEPPEPYEQLQ